MTDEKKIQRYRDVDKLQHPWREHLTPLDWQRLARIANENSDERCSKIELEAYEDYMFDLVAGQLQNVPGSLSLN